MPAKAADYKLVTYAGAKGARAGLLVEDRVYDSGEYPSVLAILRDWRRFARKKWTPGNAKGIPLKKAKLLAPLPEPGAISQHPTKVPNAGLRRRTPRAVATSCTKRDSAPATRGRSRQFIFS